MISWNSYKDPITGYTVVEVTNGKRTIRTHVTPYNAKRMTPNQFKRLIKMLKESLEV